MKWPKATIHHTHRDRMVVVGCAAVILAAVVVAVVFMIGGS